MKTSISSSLSISRHVNHSSVLFSLWIIAAASCGNVGVDAFVSHPTTTTNNNNNNMPCFIHKSHMERSTILIRHASEQLTEPTETETSESSSSEAAAALSPTKTTSTPPTPRRHLYRGLLLSSFSDGLVPNPQAIDFCMDSLVDCLWNARVQELTQKVQDSVLASPCCGPTDMDSFQELLDAFDDADNNCDNENNKNKKKKNSGSGGIGIGGEDSSSSWKARFQKLYDAHHQQHSQQRQQSCANEPLELRFLYIPTAMYALRKDSTNSPGKQRQRARADGKKRRTQIVRLLQQQFATTAATVVGANQEEEKEEKEERECPVNILAISLDLDDGSLKQPEGSDDKTKFPTTGMEALGEWKPHFIYIQGGNTFWLYHCMEKGNWKNALVHAISDSAENPNPTPAVYCGTSAGAILAGSRMEPATWKEWDDPSVVPDRPNYKDWKTVAGLDLAGEGVSVFPHMAEQWQALVNDKLAQQLEEDSDTKPEVYCLQDDEVVCVDGRKSGPNDAPLRTVLKCRPPATEADECRNEL